MWQYPIAMDTILFQSLIDIDKWNDARWTAVAFLHDPEGIQAPYMGLVFENIEADEQYSPI